MGAKNSSTYPVKLAATLGDGLRSAKQELVTQWLDRISARVAISTKRVFPTHELLNHVPLLIEGIAGYLKRPERDIKIEFPRTFHAGTSWPAGSGRLRR